MSLVAFDFDGTLSDSEMTVLLGEQADVADQMAKITEQAMNDGIGYAESLRKRVRLLEGLAATDAETAFDAVRLRPGAAAVITALRDAGVPTVILTGGFERGVQAALDHEGVTVDAIVSNRVVIEDGTLTGDVTGPLIEGTKDDALSELCAEFGVPVEAAYAVGDGANDRPMLETAGRAVGFQPKDAVRPSCDVVVTEMEQLHELLEADGVLPAGD